MEKPAPAPHAIAPEVLVLGSHELCEQGTRAGVWFARSNHKVEKCWSRQIPCLSELEFQVSVLPHRKPGELGILRELPAWLPSPGCCLPGQGDTLQLLSSMRRSTLSALEHKQMPGGPQLHLPPPQYVMGVQPLHHLSLRP